MEENLERKPFQEMSMQELEGYVKSNARDFLIRSNFNIRKCLLAYLVPLVPLGYATFSVNDNNYRMGAAVLGLLGVFAAYKFGERKLREGREILGNMESAMSEWKKRKLDGFR
jgi:hypothetical protein